MKAPKRPPRRRAGWLIAASLTVVTAAAYWETFSNGFVYFDDNGYVAENSFVRKGLTVESLAYAWTTFDLGNWNPLVWMSYELDVALWGHRVQALHVTDLVLHVASVLLLFYLADRMTGATGCSAVLAALWGLHPLHVESVAWIAERKDVLSTLFLFVSLVCYERYAVDLKRAWYAGMFAAFVLGMLSKPMLVTLPVLLLLLDFWPLGRWRRPGDNAAPGKYVQRSTARLVVEKLPVLVVAAAFAGVAVWAQRTQSAVASLEMHPLPFRVNNMFESYLWYLAKTFVPTELSAYYPLTARPIDWVRLTAIAAFLLAVCCWAFVCRRRHPWLICGWSWFVISILPVVGLVQLGSAAHADRYTYVPHIGLFFAIVWEADFWLSKLPRGAVLKVTLAGLQLVFYFLLTFLQVGYWSDAQSLWKHALDVDRKNWMAHLHLGLDELKRDDIKAAMQHLDRAIDLNPGCRDAYLIVAAIHQHQQRWDLAERNYHSALKADPNNTTALLNLGRIYRLNDRFPAARETLLRCLAIDPGAARAREELELVEKAEHAQNEQR
ncbi:MAG: tetratricopeptide repeat protein [Planctomycetia bacterium]|nr:tetratricopeptide repeat protein [Planctomycetia bacterium]